MGVRIENLRVAGVNEEDTEERVKWHASKHQENGLKEWIHTQSGSSKGSLKSYKLTATFSIAALPPALLSPLFSAPLTLQHGDSAPPPAVSLNHHPGPPPWRENAERNYSSCSGFSQNGLVFGAVDLKMLFRLG
ncbi:hypothetical protein OJAV_G00058210 [Oryzias javanicus]|uniref:Uncharacterized protein n=1 Tax=Oryzias javanicus TaxID=123683 RepID=A0A437DB17_ORYJA|nr:hypothetical protein OJAV_G00058210 [Oryzias javanicus]